MKHQNPDSDRSATFADPHRSLAPHDLGLWRSTVLLALFEEGHPTVSLLRAFATASLLDADLQVLRVLPEGAPRDLHDSRESAATSPRREQQSSGADDATRAWIRSTLGERSSAAERCMLVRGDFVEQVAQQANDLGAALIVISPCDRPLGSTVTALARAAGIPVLLARAVAGGRTVIAATDLEDEETPDSCELSELALRMATLGLAIHNLDYGDVPSNDTGYPAPMVLDGEFRESGESHRGTTTRESSTDAPADVQGDEGSVETILQTAHSHDADLIVVETRGHDGGDNLADRSVAEQVVDRARHSVLVLPSDIIKLTSLMQTGHA